MALFFLLIINNYYYSCFKQFLLPTAAVLTMVGSPNKLGYELIIIIGCLLAYLIGITLAATLLLLND